MCVDINVFRLSPLFCFHFISFFSSFPFHGDGIESQIVLMIAMTMMKMTTLLQSSRSVYLLAGLAGSALFCIALCAIQQYVWHGVREKVFRHGTMNASEAYHTPPAALYIFNSQRAENLCISLSWSPKRAGFVSIPEYRMQIQATTTKIPDILLLKSAIEILIKFN